MPDPILTTPPPLASAAQGNRFAFVPMADANQPAAALGALLKRPGSLIYQLHQAGASSLLVTLAAATLVFLALEGLSIGSFSGGVQWWAAPLKMTGGTFLSALICLPSLYIFGCLSGADIRLKPLCGAVLATLCLNALLLIGFAPVAWVFSQSTDSVAFIGTLHLIFWTVSMLFALRLLSAHMTYVGAMEHSYLRLWFIVFLLVCFQMTAALRPLIGRSPQMLPTQKVFFLTHWNHSLDGLPD